MRRRPTRTIRTPTITGITAWLFPEWFIAQYEERNPETGVRSRPLVHRLDLDKGHALRARQESDTRWCQSASCRRAREATSATSTGACSSTARKTSARAPLWMDERGTSGDLTDITIRCECGKFKALSAATKLEDVPLGYCNGPRPWLGQLRQGAVRRAATSEGQLEPAARALCVECLFRADAVGDFDSRARRRRCGRRSSASGSSSCSTSSREADVARERKKQKVSAALEGFSDAEVWKESSGGRRVRRRRRKASARRRSRRCCRRPSTWATISPDGDFFARNDSGPERTSRRSPTTQRVVKVHRLREVIAQVGFTRFESAVPDVNGELALDVERAALSLESVVGAGRREPRRRASSSASTQARFRTGSSVRRSRPGASSSRRASMPGRRRTRDCQRSSRACRT